jgi:uncharacterized membrane protein
MAATPILNVMRGPSSQLVLSILVGTLAYSTVGLHTVGTQAAGGAASIPRLAVSGSLALALASVGALLYFLHHLARSIQIDIDAIMTRVEREARWVIDDLYPDQSGSLEPEPRCPNPPASALVLLASRSGYIQAVQHEQLLRATADHDLVVRLARQVGDHVLEGTALAWAWRRMPDQSPVNPQLLQAVLNDTVTIGFEPTMVQDARLGLRRLVDIGNTALSPAVNDPNTGIETVHHLSVLLCILAGRRLGDRVHHDQQGTLRIAVPLPQFADYLRLGTAQLQRSGAKEPAVACSLIQLLKDVGWCALSEDRRQACARHIWLVLEDAMREIAQPADAEPVQAQGAVALAALAIDRPG